MRPVTEADYYVAVPLEPGLPPGYPAIVGAPPAALPGLLPTPTPTSLSCTPEGAAGDTEPGTGTGTGAAGADVPPAQQPFRSIASEYRPAVSVCHAAALEPGTAGRARGFPPAALTSGGRGVRGIPLREEAAGAYAFCFTSGGHWNVLPQPLTVHGPVRYALVDAGAAPGRRAGDAVEAGAAFGLRVDGFGLSAGDAVAVAAADCEGAELRVDAGQVRSRTARAAFRVTWRRTGAAWVQWALLCRTRGHGPRGSDGYHGAPFI